MKMKMPYIRKRERKYIAIITALLAVLTACMISMVIFDRQLDEIEKNLKNINSQTASMQQNTIKKSVDVDKYKVFDTRSVVYNEESASDFVFYDIPQEYKDAGGYFPEKIQLYTYYLCKEYGIRYDLVVAVIEKESGYVFDKVGDGGKSIGYMQINENCHKDRMQELGDTDLTDPYQNIEVGIDYLASLIDKYGTIQDALTAYNQGETGAKENVWSKEIYICEYNHAVMSRMKEIEKELADGI